MLKRLGIFAILAVCFLMTMTIVGCQIDLDPLAMLIKPPIEPPPKEKTFKEQLVEGSWRMVTTLDGEDLNTAAQIAADGFAVEADLPVGSFKGTLSQNSLRFDNAGKTTWIFGIKFSNPNNPEDWFLDSVVTAKGSYWIGEDSGSSALLTLSFTEGSTEILFVNGNREEVPDIPDEMRGNVAKDVRASINGDQLRVGNIIAERN